MRMELFAAVAAATMVAGSAHATIVTFDALSGNQANPLVISGATFTATSGFNYFSNGSLCPSTSSSNPANCTVPLEIAFAAPAEGISFTFWANNMMTIGADIGDVTIFSGANELGVVDVRVVDTDGTANSHDLVSLAGFTNVTRIVITSTDFGGLLYDDFNFVPSAAVPEPATWAFMIAGFGLAGGALRRRSAATRAEDMALGVALGRHTRWGLTVKG